MGMTPYEYLESFVEGNLSDCEEDPSSVRRACNAAVSASHLADHFYAYNHRKGDSSISQYKKLGDFLEHLCQETGGAFRDIRSIANAYKHLYTTGSYAAHSSVSSAGTIESIVFDRSCEGISAIEDEYQVSAEDSPGRAYVVVTRKDGTKIEFLPLLRKVVDYWRGKL